MTYHAHLSPRSLITVVDPLKGYPKHWELMKWYLCWRKYPYPSEVVAALMAEMRPPEDRHYPCPIDPTHWHIGRRSEAPNDIQRRIRQAKRTYRKAVRDEIWRNHVVREEERSRERADA